MVQIRFFKRMSRLGSRNILDSRMNKNMSSKLDNFYFLLYLHNHSGQLPDSFCGKIQIT